MPHGTTWEKALNEGSLVNGVISGRVKGGLTVMTNGIRAFLPGSLVDMRPVRTPRPTKVRVEFKVIKPTASATTSSFHASRSARRDDGRRARKLLANPRKAPSSKGIVKNITDYGAFV